MHHGGGGAGRYAALVSRSQPPASAALESAHEWISTEVNGESWLFDLTFLTSDWQCIWGAGCPGVGDAPNVEANEGCCSYGAHFTGSEDQDRVLQSAERLTPEQWQFHDEAVAQGSPLRTDDEGDMVTRRDDGACIFLNLPGFSGGAGCALHIAAVEAGERPLDWKPDVCWQLPIRVVEEIDENEHTTNIVREWKRYDWGEGGTEFHWWCTEEPDAFTAADPVYVHQRDELVELMGEDVYDAFTALVSARPTETLLPHPALRRNRQT